MKRMNFRRLGLGLTVLAAVLVVGVCYLMNAMPDSYADPMGGDSNDNNVGGCGSGGTNCTRWGVTWVKQPLNEFLQSSERVGLDAQNKQDMIDACQGMTDPYVYRLAYVDFANGGRIQLGSVSGLISNERADRNNAVYVDPSTIPGGMSAAEAQMLFNYALSIGVDMQYDWNQMSIFAFDEVMKTCGTDQACAQQKLQEKIDEGDPSKGGGGSATAFFQAKTIIDVGDGIPEGRQDTGWDGHTSIEFSTDKPSVTVQFQHEMEYNPGGFALSGDDVFTTSGTAGGISNPPDTADVADTTNNFTPYNITTGGGGTFGIFTTSGASQNFGTTSQTVSLSPGETKTVCSYINYSHKFANMKSKKHITVKHVPGVEDDPATPDVNEYVAEVPEESHFDWYLSGYSGSGSSGACATITRPSDPTGSPVNPNASAGGSTNSNIMFAGESSSIGWNIHGPSYNVRRLKERQTTAHLVDVIPGHDGRYFASVPRSWSSPYDYFYGGHMVEHHLFQDISINETPDNYQENFNIVVPDYVGYKYCHTGGYRYESWYSINGNWSHDTRTDYNWRNYWYVYGASCRTVAKKPSVAIWNGNLLTNGGLTVSASPRHDDTRFGLLTGGKRRLYGTWGEHLVVARKNISNFTSAAGLALGSDVLDSRALSRLTIANKNQSRLGYSDILPSTTWRTRLTTFLESRATEIGGTLSGLTNVNETLILKRNGDLNIVQDIKLNSGPYDSVHRIPQVIIFVNGNVKIASDVQQIDAWIIASGEVNTCAEFRRGETEADARNYDRPYCTKQLVFNGPVLADKLVLRRSFGSDPIWVDAQRRLGTFGATPAKYNPAEVFNLRADTYLWAYAQAGRYDSSYTESYFRELAPRY